MLKTEIESMLRKEIGLDANSIGSKAIEYAIEQRRLNCYLPDLNAYYNYLKTSPKEFEALIESVVISETWFFRDREPFTYLYNWIKADWKANSILRVLSAPCSTGEEPYSIAITLLQAGLSSEQFQIDAIDISHIALEKAKRGIYTKRSFRGNSSINPDYFRAIGDRYEVRSQVRQSVEFIQENLLESKILKQRNYHIIFCRNLLIYLDSTARTQLINRLDHALNPSGLLFVGSAETAQIPIDRYQSIRQTATFAYRKVQPNIKSPNVPPLKSPFKKNLPTTLLSEFEQAKELFNQGKLAEAAQLCELHLIRDRTNANAYLLLGKIYQELQQIPLAEQSFQKAIYLNPEFYEALIEYALLKEQQGDLATATLLRARVQRILNL